MRAGLIIIVKTLPMRAEQKRAVGVVLRIPGVVSRSLRAAMLIFALGPIFDPVLGTEVISKGIAPDSDGVQQTRGRTTRGTSSSARIVPKLGPLPRLFIIPADTVRYTYGVGTIFPTSLLNLGTLAPGTIFSFSTPPPSIGKVKIRHNYIQGDQGALNVELASTASFDRVRVRRSAMLSGALNVSYLDGFEPKPGDVFPILTAGNRVHGEFSDFNDARASAPF
jgi:hypothetical protein